MSDIPVISVVARSGSGKTFLLEKLIKKLKNMGLKVAVIKHDVHGFEIDHPGKDTWRFTQAGADIVAISSPDKFALIEKRSTELTLEEIEEHLTGVDLILTEGYKKGSKPKIEVFRSEVHRDLLCEPGELLALASDIPWDLGIPCYHIDDVEGVAQEVIRYIKK